MTALRTLAIKEILAAMDFSSLSNKAFEAAQALAQHFKARLHVLHVAADASERKVAEAKLESLAAEPIEGVEVVSVAAVGQAAPEIVKYAQREKIDVIVLGTHGRSGLARIFMGSVAEAVMRFAPCQVLTIGPKAQASEEAAAPVPVVFAPQDHCLVCAKPSQKTICDSCKAYIVGEAIERKRREEQPGQLT
jgi:nucleotide-binding universal stress UspA family protein